MTLAIILASLALAAIIGTIAAVRSDGYRPVRTDWTRLEAQHRPTRRSRRAQGQWATGRSRR